MKIFKFVLVGYTVLASLGIQAQSLNVDDGVTNVFSADYSIGATNLLIGVTTNNNVLQVNNGATFTAGHVFTGYSSADNRLEAVNGATIDVSGLIVGVFENASNNTVTVSGGTIDVDGNLVVGQVGGDNRLEVSDQGSLSSEEAWVGYTSTSDDNVVLVSGTDSEWINSGALTIGTNGNSGNFVTVTNGGHISVGSLEILETDDNGFDLDRGGQLTVTDGFDASMDGFNYNEGSALYVGGLLTGMTNGIEGERTLGIVGEWDQAGMDVSVGSASDENSLVVQDGGLVTADNLTVGAGSNTTDNTVSVLGNSSELNVAGTVTVGSLMSSNNAVELSSSGKMTIGTGLTINSNNTFTVRDYGHLVAKFDFNASQAGFDLGTTGILETTGTLTGMTNVLENGRSVRLSGGGTWAAGGLVLGESTSGNSVEVTSGGVLGSTDAVLGASAGSDRNSVLVDGAGSVWTDGGAVTIGDAGSYNTVTVSDSAKVTSSGLSLGVSGDHNTATISGAAEWESGDVSLGVAGSNNRIVVEDGGELESGTVEIGGTGTENHGWVSGAGALWTTTGDVAISGAGNALNLTDGGKLDAGGQLAVTSGADLKFETGAQATAASYYQDGSSVMQFDNMTNNPATPLVIVSGAATIEDGAIFEYTGSISNVGVGVTYSNRLIESTSLVADLDALIGISSNNLLGVEFLAQDDDLYFEILRQSLAEAAGFDPGTQMHEISDEIDSISTNTSVANQQTAVNQLGLLGQVDGSTKNAQLTQLYERGAPTYMHMEGMLEGMRQVKRSGVMPDSMWPVGAGGPHLYGDQVKGWMKGYGSWASQDGADSYASYDQDLFGVVLGFDKAFGDLLAGLAGGYTSSDISQDDGDSSESSIGYGMLYGSWGSSAWFADASLAFGMGSVKNQTGTMFDNSAEFDSSQLAFYLGGGKELLFSDDRLIVTPSAGVLGSFYMQDGYTEKAVNAVARKVDDYDRFSFRSEFGVQAVFHKELKKNVLMPEAHVNWLHEFNDDEDVVGYSLVGGTGSYSFGMQAPVADIFEVGVGLSLWAESQSDVTYEWSIGFDSRFGSGYSASTLGARLVAEF
ncbi:autotransporter domain-containing protein [Pontiellaceae bacterium B12227]|nr:autotransporter domain-containing protein [Pontiellaceae bacterium B12227]